MGGRSLVLGLHAVAVASLLAAWPAAIASAEEAKAAAVPLAERTPKHAAGSGAEVELPVKAPPHDGAGLAAAPDPDQDPTDAQSDDKAQEKQAKQKRDTPASERTNGDRASTGTAGSAAQKGIGSPKRAETAASPGPAKDAAKPADAAASPASSADEQKPATAAAAPSNGEQEAAAPEPSGEEKKPAEASPDANDSAPQSDEIASPAPSDDAQDAAPEGAEKPADTAAASPGEEEKGKEEGALGAAPAASESGEAPAGEPAQEAAALAPGQKPDSVAAPSTDDVQSGSEEGALDAAPAPGDAEQKPAAAAPTASGSDTASPPAEPVPPPPSNPVVAAVLAQLKDPAFTKGANPNDVAALETFYAGHGDSPLWVEGAGFSAKAQAIVGEIKKADEWGLSAADFVLPPATELPSTPEAQAAEEVKLSLAILKYARHARGGRLTPGRISVLFDQKLGLRDPKAVLAEISTSDAPDAYLRSLHPQQPQFARLREALARARSAGGEGGQKTGNDREIQRLIVNMERWRWMPASLGSYYVWNNVPEYIGRVIKNGKTIYAERIIVGQLKYATPFFSATMRSIVFHPEWTVPETILKEDLQPALQQGGFFGMPDTSILSRHGLRVNYKGKPIDPDTVNWLNVNIREYSFVQPPGPANVLGQLKFNFPNRHAVYMHDTPQRELFAETVRTLSHGCIRVRQPERLAALLLAEDKGWPEGQVRSLLAREQNEVVKLNRSIPVHLTYFTVVIDEEGKANAFADIYGLDGRMATALFGKAAKFSAPVMAEADAGTTASTQPAQRKRRNNWMSRNGIPGIFGN